MAENEVATQATTGTLKKKRAQKKAVLGNADPNTMDMADMAGMLSLAEKQAHSEKEMRSAVGRLGNHFQFGNGAAGGPDTASNKTSNNKLDQSMRISYAEMAETLRSYTPACADSIEAVNKMYEDSYFPEWLRLMKYSTTVAVALLS
jgi:hypothetical protein